MENKPITAICQECNTQFEYVLKPGFPRKYCPVCSVKKKAEFEAGKTAPKDTPTEAPRQSSDREKSIIAQCLTKVVFENKADFKVVLETYKNFLKEL